MKIWRIAMKKSLLNTSVFRCDQKQRPCCWEKPIWPMHWSNWNETSVCWKNINRSLLSTITPKSKIYKKTVRSRINECSERSNQIKLSTEVLTFSIEIVEKTNYERIDLGLKEKQRTSEKWSSSMMRERATLNVMINHQKSHLTINHLQ